MPREIGRQLQDARKSAGLTLWDVANKSSPSSRGRTVTAGALSLIEHGERANPTLRVLEAYAKALRLTIVVTPQGVRVVQT